MRLLPFLKKNERMSRKTNTFSPLSSPALFLERRNALGSREIHPPVRAGQSLPGPGDCVVTRAGGHERGSIDGRRSYPKLSRLFPQRDSGFVGQRKYLIFSRLDPTKNHCLMIPRECPPARVSRFRYCDPVSRRGGAALCITCGALNRAGSGRCRVELGQDYCKRKIERGRNFTILNND